MSLIDLKRLNAEVDELIRRQDEEVKAMKDKKTTKYEELHMWFITDLAELIAVAGEVLEYGDEICVETEIKSHYGKPSKNLVVGFSKANKLHVHISIEPICYIGTVCCDETDRSSYKRNKENLSRHQLTANLDEILLKWREQYPTFKQRFEEECLKEIKKKAERANARYESARRELDETK